MFFWQVEPTLIKIHTLAPLWLWSDDIMPVVVCCEHMIAADDSATFHLFPTFWQQVGRVALNPFPYSKGHALMIINKLLPPLKEDKV